MTFFFFSSYALRKLWARSAQVRPFFFCFCSPSSDSVGDTGKEGLPPLAASSCGLVGSTGEDEGAEEEEEEGAGFVAATTGLVGGMATANSETAGGTAAVAVTAAVASVGSSTALGTLAGSVALGTGEVGVGVTCTSPCCSVVPLAAGASVCADKLGEVKAALSGGFWLQKETTGPFGLTGFFSAGSLSASPSLGFFSCFVLLDLGRAGKCSGPSSGCV